MKPSGFPASSDNSRTLEIYERTLRVSKTYRGDPVAIIDDALETEPENPAQRRVFLACLAVNRRPLYPQKLPLV